MDTAQTKTEFVGPLRTHVGASGTPRVARDPVNEPSIRNWCDAMSEANPYFTDPAAAAGGPHGGGIAPTSAGHLHAIQTNHESACINNSMRQDSRRWLPPIQTCTLTGVFGRATS